MCAGEHGKVDAAKKTVPRGGVLRLVSAQLPSLGCQLITTEFYVKTCLATRMASVAKERIPAGIGACCGGQHPLSTLSVFVDSTEALKGHPTSGLENGFRSWR